jgi:hypothetical protein
MYGVENATSAAGMVRAAAAHHGALGLARTAVREVLSKVGFVDVTGSLDANFETYLSRSPVEMEIEDLKPGLLSDLVSWVAGVLAGDPTQGLEAQAHVQPRAAVKLLT